MSFILDDAEKKAKVLLGIYPSSTFLSFRERYVVFSICSEMKGKYMRNVSKRSSKSSESVLKDMFLLWQMYFSKGIAFGAHQMKQNYGILVQFLV